jgi:hypothetical protein
MAPTEVTRAGKPKRNIVISTIEITKELTSKWEIDTRLSDLAEQHPSYNYY